MSTPAIIWTPHNPTGVESTLKTEGMTVEDINRPDGGRRFRFVTLADAGVANLTPEQAADLGRWLIAQAERRAE
ncbi:hypothetical protein [Methylobacterium sp. CCH5-D2]|uniref:hypothetical protein n=1 Tax=Methylobacterium sp. CCH5-D2 TaxID=1768765 RepID=UPI0008367402|nr:hypothetical protein [Methylobacterium sp. CCH5-D2]